MSETNRPRSGDGSYPVWHTTPKLTPAQRDEIRKRRANGEKAMGLAAEYRVSVRIIYELS